MFEILANIKDYGFEGKYLSPVHYLIVKVRILKLFELGLDFGMVKPGDLTHPAFFMNRIQR